MSDENVNENDSHDQVDEAVVAEAASQGWVPKEKFRGNEEDWVDAEVFVKRGREIMPILRKNNESLLKELSATKSQLTELRTTAKEFEKFQKESYERKVQEYEHQLRELKAAKAQAIADGDGTKVNAIDDAMDEVKTEKAAAEKASKEEPASSPAAPIVIDPQLQTWIDTNEWFGSDRRMTKIANTLGEDIREEFPNLIGKPFLDKLDEALREEFPEKFSGKPKRSSPVESGAGRSGSRTGASKHSYENLPSDAKAACDRFVKQKLMTKEDYVASYDWS